MTEWERHAHSHEICDTNYPTISNLVESGLVLVKRILRYGADTCSDVSCE